MKSSKRSRGRPVGTGLDDSPTLRKVADMILANPLLRPTTAIRSAFDKPGTPNIRRLQVKWKAATTEYLADARARRAMALAPARRATVFHFSRISQTAEGQRRMLDALGPSLRAAHGMMNSPAMLAAQEAARRYQASPVMRALEGYRNCPLMRAIEELQNSPIMMASRGLQSSPMMQATREIEKMHRLIGGGF